MSSSSEKKKKVCDDCALVADDARSSRQRVNHETNDHTTGGRQAGKAGVVPSLPPSLPSIAAVDEARALYTLTLTTSVRSFSAGVICTGDTVAPRTFATGREVWLVRPQNHVPNA